MRTPIQYNFADGQLLYAVLTGGPAIRVHIELPNGKCYGSWSVEAPGAILQTNEFVAQTWGDTGGLMASAMLGTGWFSRTGHNIAVPAEESNEIWQLTELGREWLATNKTSEPVAQH